MSTPSTPPAEGPSDPADPPVPENTNDDTTAGHAPQAMPPSDERPTAQLFVPPVVNEPPSRVTAELPQVTSPIAPAWAALIRRSTFGQAVVMVTGLLLFIWGFLPWYSDQGGSANAWSTVTIPGLMMTATWVPLLSLAIVIFIALKVFANGFPDHVLGFSWAQLSVMVALFDVLITLGFLVANRSLGNLGTLDLGPGLILSFITSLIMLAGAVTDHLGKGADLLDRLRPPGEAPHDHP